VRHLLGIRRATSAPARRRALRDPARTFFEAIELPATFDAVVFAKMELMRLPCGARPGVRYGLIGVERDAGAKALRTMLTEARRLIANGRPLAIFPEGTRVPHGAAAAAIGLCRALQAAVLPVVPVAVNSGPLYHRLWKRRAPSAIIRRDDSPGLPAPRWRRGF
jgi:1-acyl-sn-glycerol-3-phosphate acyltransferase